MSMLCVMSKAIVDLKGMGGKARSVLSQKVKGQLRLVKFTLHVSISMYKCY